MKSSASLFAVIGILLSGVLPMARADGDPSFCTLEHHPCPHDDEKVRVCRYNPYAETFRTTCIFSSQWNQNRHSKDYCGPCSLEDEPRVQCFPEETPCSSDYSKIEICLYNKDFDSYSTKCVTPESFNNTIAFIDEVYCGPCSNADLNRCVDENLIFFDDFEQYANVYDLAEAGWVNGRLAEDDYFTKILGRFDGDDPHPQINITSVPKADYYFVRFDFLEIDDWEDPDCFIFYVNGVEVNLGFYVKEIDEGIKSGVTPEGVAWVAKSVTPPIHIGFNSNHVDQIHEVTARVPAVLVAEYIHLRFDVLTDEGRFQESAGIDNVKVTAFNVCAPCIDHKIIVKEDFESYTSIADMGTEWTNAKLDQSSGFTKFLGRYDKSSSLSTLDPLVRYDVPPDADYLVVEFDFYEIDSWAGEDCFYAYINGELLDMRYFKYFVDEGYKGGVTDNGIVWVMDSNPNPPAQIGYHNTVDQIHKIRARVPAALFVAGTIEIRFVFRLDDQQTDETGGVDNIIIKAHYDCGTCLPTEVIEYEDFEDYSLEHWVNGRIDTDPGLTKFLGRYDKEDEVASDDPVKVYFVPADVDFMVLEFDFYEIDEWEGQDCVYAYINNEELDINIFNQGVDEGFKYGTSDNGIYWESRSKAPESQIAFGSAKDQIHHVTAYIPKYIVAAGLLQLRLATRINDAKENESSGYDNIKITAHNDCGPCIPDYVIVFEDFEDESTQGWTNGRLDFDMGFTTFLGMYNTTDSLQDGSADPKRSYDVPPSASYITVEFDFYEIDAWTEPDCLYIFINGERCDVLFFDAEVDEGIRNGATPNGIQWSSKSTTLLANIGFNASVYDQKHHFAAIVPPSLYENGKLNLQLATRISSIENVHSGFDNFKITTHFDCAYPSAAPSGMVPTLSDAPSLSAAPSAKATPRPTHRPTPYPTARPTPKPTTAFPTGMPSAVPIFIAPPFNGLGTFVPTSAPSVSLFPTPIAPASPVSSPVEPHTCDCNDAEGRSFFASVDYPSVNCAWLRAQPNWLAALCNPTEPAWFYCPVTCGRCPTALP